MDNTITHNMQPDLFPVLTEIPQAKRNCRLGCQTETDLRHQPGILNQAALHPSVPGLAACLPAARRPRGLEARRRGRARAGPPVPPLSAHLPGVRCAPGRPAQLHRTPARSQRAPAPLLGRPGSSPHKERRLSTRVNLAGPGANTIGQVFTNEVSLRLR